MNENEKLAAARDRVIETIAQNMDLYGISDSIGRLYGMMYFHNRPMTLDDMKEELGMSKTSMSTSVRSLMELKMAEKVWRKGERKDLYQAEEDWHQMFIDQFSIRWRPSITMNISMMEKSKRELESIVNAEHANEEIKLKAMEDIQKLSSALDYYDWLNRLVTCFESGEIFNYIKKENPNKK